MAGKAKSGFHAGSISSLDTPYINPLEQFNNDVSVQDQLNDITDIIKNRCFYLAMKGVSSSDIGVTLDLQTYTIEQVLKETVNPMVLIKIGRQDLGRKVIVKAVVDKDTGEELEPAQYEDRSVSYKELQLVCRTGRVEVKTNQADLVDRVRAKSLLELEKKLDTKAIHSTRELLGVLKTLGVGETGGAYAPGHDMGHVASPSSSVNIAVGAGAVAGQNSQGGLVQLNFDKSKMGSTTPLVNGNKEVIGIKSRTIDSDGVEIEKVEELGNISRKGLEDLAYKGVEKKIPKSEIGMALTESGDAGVKNVLSSHVDKNGLSSQVEKNVLSSQRGEGKASDTYKDEDSAGVSKSLPAASDSEIDDFLVSELG